MPNVFTTCAFEIIYQVDSACLWSILCISQCILSHLLSDNLSCDKGVLFFLERTELTIDSIHSTYSFQTWQVHLSIISWSISPNYLRQFFLIPQYCTLIERLSRNLIYSAPWPCPSPREYLIKKAAKNTLFKSFQANVGNMRTIYEHKGSGP